MKDAGQFDSKRNMDFESVQAHKGPQNGKAERFQGSSAYSPEGVGG